MKKILLLSLIAWIGIYSQTFAQGDGSGVSPSITDVTWDITRFEEGVIIFKFKLANFTEGDNVSSISTYWDRDLKLKHLDIPLSAVNYGNPIVNGLNEFELYDLPPNIKYQILITVNGEKIKRQLDVFTPGFPETYLVGLTANFNENKSVTFNWYTDKFIRNMKFIVGEYQDLDTGLGKFQVKLELPSDSLTPREVGEAIISDPFLETFDGEKLYYRLCYITKDHDTIITDLKSFSTKLGSIGGIDLQSKKFEVYPNPAKETLNVFTDFHNYKVIVYNMFGQAVKEQTVKGGQSEINVLDLKPGTYLLLFTSGGESIHKKFTVAR